MAEVKDYWQGDLAATLKRQLEWLVSRMNVNVSALVGNVVTTPTSLGFAEGACNAARGRLDDLAQVESPNIVFDPLKLPDDLDQQQGPDGFPINYSPLILGPSGQTIINVLDLSATKDVSGRAFNLLDLPDHYRVDVFSLADVFYYQGSAAIGEDGSWKLAGAHVGVVIAVLYPATAPPPTPGSWLTELPADWLAHSNTGVGKKLRDYFVRLYVKTDIEYLQEDNIPIIVQDSIHARFGSCKVPSAGTLVAHVLYNHPTLGPVDLYSTLQNEAVYSDLPRAIEVPLGDPDFVDAADLTNTNVAAIQNRSWIYSAALAIMVLSAAGLWRQAKRLILRLNMLRENPGYLPSQILESAEDGLTSRWSLLSGTGTISNADDATEPPYGSKVIAFTATGTSVWDYGGAGLPETYPNIAWRFKTDIASKFIVGVESSTGKVTSVEFVPNSSSGYTVDYDSPNHKITVQIPWNPNCWRAWTQDLSALISSSVSGETLISIDSFKVELDSTGELRLDNLSVGAPQPQGSLSFSYDVYNGQVDQAYIRSGAIAWAAYAYGIYMERTADFEPAALGLESMLNFLFSLQSQAPDLRQNLILGGWGKYQDPGYEYVPGQVTWVSTEHNLDCYYAFDQAARVLPSAAQTLYQRKLISAARFSSLQNTALTAHQKAQEVKAAILNQLWIPASGSVKGHFAQGADVAGLDTSLALDASGSWAAMFCYDVGETTKALECLQFIYETFFLTGQQILKTSDPNAYNQAYEELVAIVGFKPYADSPGGYSGSPDSLWMEGTWGAIAAYLRLADNTTLQTYFNANYSGGLPAFLSQLIHSMQLVSATSGDHGLLDFSLAARHLPWEFSVRPTIASMAWFWSVATRNGVALTKQSPLEGQPLLKVPQGVQQSIDHLEGRGSIGALELEVIDGAGWMTALVSGGKLEGRKVTLKVGYPGLSAADFVTVATQQIEAVQVLGDYTGYRLQCRDLKRSAKSKIFLLGDDGYPISAQHPRTLTANPIDIALLVLQNELGIGQVPGSSPEDWVLYDPALWNNGSNWTLLNPNSSLDVDQFLFYRFGIFAGCLFEFTFDQPVEAKQFLEYESFKPLGGWMLVLADGRISCRFSVPPYSLTNLPALNEQNMTVLPGVERHPIINQVTYRMDYADGKFQTELLFVDAPSLQQYGLAGQHIIESKGMKLSRGGAALAGLSSQRIFRRYAGLDPVSGEPNGGTPLLTVTSHFMTCPIEVGDCVFVSHPLFPNFTTGERGVYSRVYEVFEKQPNFAEGTMTYKLLDVAWTPAKQLSRAAPPSTPAWSSANSAQRGRFMFLCADPTLKYSDGTAGKTVW